MSTKTQPPGRERAQFTCDTMGTTLAIRVRGEIDHHTAASIRQGMDAVLFEKRPRKLILDLSAVSFMDSSGLGLIMGRYSVMKELEGEMVVWNPSPETRSIITLAGMERMVSIQYPEGSSRAPQDAPSRQTPRNSAKSRAATSGTSPRRRKKPATPSIQPKSDRKEKDA